MSEKNKKDVTIDGEVVTGDFIYKKSCELIKYYNQIKMMSDSLGNVYYQVQKGDVFALNYFGMNGLETVLENLHDIEAGILEISNALCPDE